MGNVNRKACMFPDSAGAPPPPPPPPPPAARPSLAFWALGLAVLLAIGAVVGVLLLRGDDTTAASTSTTSTSTPTTTSISTSTSAPTTTTTTLATTTLPIDLGYTEEELAYFAEIAGQAEYGDTGGNLHRWTGEVRIAVYGEPTVEDWEVLTGVITELNGLTGTVNLTVVEADPNLEIYIVPETEFASIEPEYQPGNQGFFYIWWDEAGAVTRGRILISSTNLEPVARAHLIREELTQSLGLLADSTRYADSIFCQEWTTVTSFAPIDQAVIEMLYRPELAPGMTIADALSILAGLDRY